MTVRQFIDAVSGHAAVLDLELRVGVSEGKIAGGQHDGGIQVRSESVECALLGESGLLLFAAKNCAKTEVILNDFAKLREIAVVGEMPDDLKM